MQVMDVSGVYPSNWEEKQVELALGWEIRGWLMRTHH